eukprot:3668_1
MGIDYCSPLSSTCAPCSSDISKDTTYERHKERNTNINIDVKQSHVSKDYCSPLAACSPLATCSPLSTCSPFSSDDSKDDKPIPPYEDLYLFDAHSNSFKLNTYNILQESVQTSSSTSNLIKSGTKEQWNWCDIEV